ncbi:MAG: anaerobic glycerol-3-phosphate dehydrogenase subunit C [Muribaculaceae bacterium]|nr:anaerobic glycerol-3-phosphate dehydrogenase subunit C [Muribaculaceae bacterium]
MNLQQQNISDNNFESCIKCTICTVYCPVTAVNPDYPGPKQAGPDGERYRLKRPFFYDKALKYCLNCKRCEVACPNEVRIGDIIQSAKLKYDDSRPSLRDTMLSSTDLMGTVATSMAPIVNYTLGLKPVKVLMDKILKIDDRRTFPHYASQRFESWFHKKAESTQDLYPRSFSYFHGCYVNYNYPQLGKDLLKVMNALGYGMHLLEGEKCCGVAKIVNRCIKEATRDAERNLVALRKAVAAGDEVLATSSTCCFTLRDEYPDVLKLENTDIREAIMLAVRRIFILLDEGKARIAFRKDYRKRIAYHVPCHMEKLGWSVFSSSLMRMIPGVDLIMLDSHCCGIAGTYGFKKEYYDYSQAIGAPVFRQIEECGCDIVASDCETCKWQIEMSTTKKVFNPISILADAIDEDETRRLNGVDSVPKVEF